MKQNYYSRARDFAGQGWSKVRKAVASEGARRYRTWLFQAYILAALIGFSALALAANVTQYFQFDLLATRDLQRYLPNWVGYLMIGISWFGYMTGSLISVVGSVAALRLLGLRWEAYSALFAAVSSLALNYLVKTVVRRPRPSSTLVEVFAALNSYSFPSGHVMFYMGFFGFLLFLSFILLKKKLWRRLAVFFFLVLILGIGISRMYLGEHWASDVIGGYLVGSLTLILAIQFYRWGKARFSKDQAVAPVTAPEKLAEKPAKPPDA